MKPLTNLFGSIVMIMLLTVALSTFLNVDAVTIGIALTVMSAGLSFMPTVKGALFAGVLVELWTGELIENFRHDHMWMQRLPSRNNYVNNDTIHLVDVGADPNVLINNNSYPIATAARNDQDIAVALKKFETENTKITEDELYALPYDKEGSVLRQHREVLEEKTSEYGLFSLAPASDTTDTPIVKTSGTTSNIVSGRKDLVIADIRKAKQKMDDLRIPKRGRVLVLCNNHVNALLQEDQSFRDRYYNTRTGEVLNFLGFDIYEDVYNPRYDGSFNKIGWQGSAGTEYDASVFFYAPRSFKARGSIRMFYQTAEQDPDNRETKAGFRLYHIAMPKKDTGFGAIVTNTT